MPRKTHNLRGPLKKKKRTHIVFSLFSPIPIQKITEGARLFLVSDFLKKKNFHQKRVLLKGFLHWDSKRTTSPKQRLKSLCWKCKKISHWTTIEDLTRYSRIPTGCIGPYYLTIGGEMTESVEQGPFRVTFLPLRWGLQGCNLLGVRLAALSRAGCLLFGKVKYQLVAPIWVSLVKSPLQP